MTNPTYQFMIDRGFVWNDKLECYIQQEDETTIRGACSRSTAKFWYQQHLRDRIDELETTKGMAGKTLLAGLLVNSSALGGGSDKIDVQIVTTRKEALQTLLKESEEL